MSLEHSCVPTSPAPSPSPYSSSYSSGPVLPPASGRPNAYSPVSASASSSSASCALSRHASLSFGSSSSYAYAYTEPLTKWARPLPPPQAGAPQQPQPPPPPAEAADVSLGSALTRFSDAVREMRQSVMLPSRLEDISFSPPPPPLSTHRRLYNSAGVASASASASPLSSGVCNEAQAQAQGERERRASSSSESGDSGLAMHGAAPDAGVLETLRDADLFDVFLLVQQLEADLLQGRECSGIGSGAPRPPSPDPPQLSGAAAEVAARVRAQALALQSSLRELTAASNAVLNAYARPAGGSCGARP